MQLVQAVDARRGLFRDAADRVALGARPLTPEERDVLRAGVKRRAAGEPLQYVTGEMPFRHIVLKVRPGVFIPRPETEILVDGDVLDGFAVTAAVTLRLEIFVMTAEWARAEKPRPPYSTGIFIPKAPSLRWPHRWAMPCRDMTTR